MRPRIAPFGIVSMPRHIWAETRPVTDVVDFDVDEEWPSIRVIVSRVMVRP